jgi:hypothetical protein
MRLCLNAHGSRSCIATCGLCGSVQVDRSASGKLVLVENVRRFSIQQSLPSAGLWTATIVPSQLVLSGSITGRQRRKPIQRRQKSSDEIANARRTALGGQDPECQVRSCSCAASQPTIFFGRVELRKVVSDGLWDLVAIVDCEREADALFVAKIRDGDV